MNAIIKCWPSSQPRLFIFIYYIISFYISPTSANTSERSAGSRVSYLGSSRVFSCASDRPFVIERQVCRLSTNAQLSTALNYTITVCYNRTAHSQTLHSCQCSGPRTNSQTCSYDRGIGTRTLRTSSRVCNH